MFPDIFIIHIRIYTIVCIQWENRTIRKMGLGLSGVGGGGMIFFGEILSWKIGREWDIIIWKNILSIPACVSTKAHLAVSSRMPVLSSREVSR